MLGKLQIILWGTSTAVSLACNVVSRKTIHALFSRLKAYYLCNFHCVLPLQCHIPEEAMQRRLLSSWSLATHCAPKHAWEGTGKRYSTADFIHV